MALPEDVRIAKALDDGDSDDEDIPVHDAPIDDVDQEFENEVARAMSPNSGGVEMSTLSQPAPPQLTGIVIEPSAPHQEDNRPDLSGSVPGIVPPGSLSPLPLRRGVSAPKSPKPMDPLLAQVIKEDYPPENVLSWTPEQKQHLIEVTTIETVPLLLIKARRAGWMSQATTVSFRNLFYRKKGSILVNGVSGYIKSGTMVAVIGQGATSLFELLCGRQKGGRMQGEILFNGSPPCDDLKNIVAMIPKDDVHLPTLTVRETIEFSSRLRVSPSFPRELAMMRNELIIKLLGLKHCAETVVGDGTLRGISGGEKRRLSVAVELVADHSVIVSDLPTNGLDSASAMRLVMMCKHSCKADYSHLMSVAQPSPQLLAQFDSVMLLSRGTCIYQGPPDRAEAYFASLNFVRPKLKNLPDFLEELCHTPGKFFVARNAYDLMGVASPQMQIAGGPDDAMAARPSVVDAQQNGVDDKNEMKGQDATALVPCHCWKKLTRAYKESKMYSDVGQTLWTELEPIYDIEPQNKPVVEEFRTSALTQLALCTIRQWKITVRNKANTFGGIGRAIFMGLLLGTLFYQLSSAQVAARARMGVLFSAIVFAGMTPIQSVAGFLQQRAVFYSQQAAGYFRGVTFFLGHLMASMPLLWLEMFIFSILLYGIAGLADNVGSARFWFFFLTMALTTMTSRSLCLLIASGSPSTHVATSVAPVAVVMCILFNGFLVSKDSIPDGWIWMYYLSFMTYGLRGIAINEYFSLDFSCRPEELVPPTSAPNYSVPPPSGYGFLQPDMGVCPFNSGHRMLERYGMDTSVEGDKWLLWVYLVIFWFGFTTLNAMILLWLDWSGQETVLSHGQDDAEEGMKKKSAHPEASTVKGDGRKKASASYVEFDNLTYTVSVKTKRRRSPPFCWKKVKAPKKLLNGVYGYAVPGKMIALMGASGAGKSTLLDVLANRKTEGEVGGKLLFNGKQRDRYFSRWAGYVEQFDSHFETSTVREAIQFSADLRLPQTISPEEKAKRVQKVMDQLELNSVADQRIGSTEHGGISPALRKKVTIAVELIMDPGMLFLDEPTTGLDSAAAMEVMTATRKLADEISVICTIHQPSEELVRLFDWLLLLQPGGSVVYFGPVAEVGSYFKKIGLGEPYPGQNIAEFALQAIGNRTADRQKEPEKFADPANLFLESAEGQAVKQKLAHGIDKELDREPASFNFDSVYATGFLWQFILLLRRFVQMQIREPAVVGTRVFVSFAVAFTVGTLYFQTGYDQPGINNRVSFFFLGLMFINFAATAVLNKVIEQRAAYFRENTSNMYSWFVFWFARFIADIPAVVIQVVLFTVISSYLAGMKDGAEFGNFFAIMLIGNLSAYAFSEACGIVGHDAEFANAINTFLLTAMMFFTGFLIQKDGIPNAWMFLYYINVFRYPLFFMIGNELHDETFGCPNNAGSVYVPVNSTYCSSQSLNDRNCFIPTCPFTDGQQMLKQFSVDSTELSELFGITVVIFVGLRIISAILFRTVNHIKR